MRMEAMVKKAGVLRQACAKWTLLHRLRRRSSALVLNLSGVRVSFLSKCLLLWRLESVNLSDSGGLRKTPYIIPEFMLATRLNRKRARAPGLEQTRISSDRSTATNRSTEIRAARSSGLDRGDLGAIGVSEAGDKLGVSPNRTDSTHVRCSRWADQWMCHLCLIY